MKISINEGEEDPFSKSIKTHTPGRKELKIISIFSKA